MAGNSKRRGAVRKAPKHTAGSGGRVRQGLEGRGPTPKAEDREYHPAHKRKVAEQARAATGRAGSSSGGPAPRRPARRSTTHEMVAGRNSVLEALRAGVPVTTVYLAARIEQDDRTREILKLAADTHRPLLEVGRLELDRMTDGAVHQGVAIQVPPYAYAEPDDLLDAAAAAGQPALVVALDGVTDPRNLGAVLRSAGAFGAHGVLVPERRAAGVTASAWKVSAGAAARVPVARATNLTRQLEKYREAGMVVVGLDVDGSVDAADLEVAADPLVVVVGAEGAGLSRLVARACDLLVRIPMARGNESLNAGVAAGIVLYEVARHRG